MDLITILYGVFSRFIGKLEITLVLPPLEETPTYPPPQPICLRIDPPFLSGQLLAVGLAKRQGLQGAAFAVGVGGFRCEKFGDQSAEQHDDKEASRLGAVSYLKEE